MSELVHIGILIGSYLFGLVFGLLNVNSMVNNKDYSSAQIKAAFYLSFIPGANLIAPFVK